MTAFNEKYWTLRYKSGQTQWDAGEITNPLKVYFDTLERKDIDILIPGGGNGYEAGYLHENRFENVFLLDFSVVPLQKFKQKYPDFPAEHLLQQDYFELEGKFDLMVEQTFFCALDPDRRPEYARKAADLLKPGGRLAGVLFEVPLNEDQPPFGGARAEYRQYFEPYFNIQKMESCYNSINPRKGTELWINMVRK